MTKSDTPNRMWGGRFTSAPSKLMQALNASIHFDRRLYRQDVAGSKAHAAMLASCGIISDADAEAITTGLDRVAAEIEAGTVSFSADLEDIHMNIESRLHELIGEPAGRLHTGRSRNDQVATDLRLWTREHCDRALFGLARVISALVDQATKGAGMMMPGFTHLQSAQPVTWGHHMLAYAEMMRRDMSRFDDARSRMNECPLGAAALAGTSFPINREMTAEALGFDRPMANSLDAVSDRDFVLDYLSAAAICATHLSRLAEEIVLWVSAQFAFAKLGDSFSTGSSIMPQKRNPDAAELVRARCGRIVGALTTVLMVMKGLPLAYSKDMQEDKEQVFDAVDTLELSLSAMAGMIADLQPRELTMREAAMFGHANATDLADFLVQSTDMPFRTAHRIVGRLVRMACDRDASLGDLPITAYTDCLAECHDPNAIAGAARKLMKDYGQAITNKVSLGGTAPSRVSEQVHYWKEWKSCGPFSHYFRS